MPTTESTSGERWSEEERSFQPKRTKITGCHAQKVDIRWVGGKRGYLWIGGEVPWVAGNVAETCLFHMTQSAARQLRDYLSEHLADDLSDPLQ